MSDSAPNPHTNFLESHKTPLGFLVLALLIAAAFSVQWPLGMNESTLASLRLGWLMPIVFAAGLWASLRGSGRLNEIAAFAWILLMLWGALVHLWIAGHDESMLVGGLLPFSDAHSYYRDILSLQQGESFSTFSTRRPFFAGFFSVILAMTGGDLMAAHSVMMLFVAFAGFYSVIIIKSTLGAAPAAMYWLVVFLFYRHSVGVTATEHLGIGFGLIGVAMVWKGAFYKQTSALYLGLFMMAMAMVSRAGAFFVLPAVTIWAAWRMRGTGWLSWRVLGFGIAAGLSAFVLNSILASTIGSSEGEAFSNFSYTLYGLVFGGDWTLVYQRDPQAVEGLSGKPLTDAIYALALQGIAENPLRLIWGAVRAWGVYFGKGCAFYFIESYPFRALFHLISLPALWLIINHYKKPQYLLLIAFGLGLVLSIPFVPPWDSGARGRVYAATVPFVALLPAIGVYWMTGLHKTFEAAQCGAVRYHKAACGLIAVWTLLATAGPIVIHGLGEKMTYPAVECEDGLTKTEITFEPGSYIVLIPYLNEESFAPRIRIDDFRNLGIIAELYPDAAEELRNLPANVALKFDSNGNLVVLPSEWLDEGVGPVSLCGRTVQREFMSFFYAQRAVFDNGAEKSLESGSLLHGGG